MENWPSGGLQLEIPSSEYHKKGEEEEEELFFVTVANATILIIWYNYK